MNAMGHPDPE
jgi:predicted TPR repeat methyltransferase